MGLLGLGSGIVLGELVLKVTDLGDEDQE